MTGLLRLFVACWFWLVGMTLFLDSPSLAVSELNSNDAFSSALESLNRENYQKALQDLTVVIDFQDNLKDIALSDRCLVNLQLHNYNAARFDCLEAIKLKPDNLEAHLNLGLAYYQLQEYQKALVENQQIIKLDRRDYRAYYNQGLVYFAMENYRQAINSYNSALKLSNLIPQEQQITILNERSLTYKRLKSYHKAIANLQQAIALNPKDEFLYFNLGCTAHEAQKTQMAIANFTRSIELNPNFTQAYMNLAVIYHQKGQEKLALHYTRTMLAKCQQTNDKMGEKRAIALEKMILKSQPSYLV